MTKRPRTILEEENNSNLFNQISDAKERWYKSIANAKVVSKIEDLPGADLDSNTIPKFLATHHGQFHCDEALALSMLKLLPEFQDVPIVRTRNQSILEKAHLVVDVGGIFDHSRLWYDHHMADFVEKYSDKHDVTKLSSAGLIYKFWGKKIIEKFAEDSSHPLDDPTPVILKLYKNFIEEVDAIDNGVEQLPDDSNYSLRYRIGSGLGSRVKRCNPSWTIESVSTELENASFKRAMLICAEEFDEQLTGLVRDWYPARRIVELAREKSINNGYSSDTINVSIPPRTIYFERCCPWQEHLLDIESEHNITKDHSSSALYVIFPDSRSNTYRIQAVPSQTGSFTNRKALPKSWRGKREEELSKESGVEGGVFVHAGGFIGGNKSIEGAMEMAKRAVEMGE